MPSNSLFNFFSGNDIFISYRWTVPAKRYALQLTKDLEKRGLNCYIAENGLSLGEIVPSSLRKAIRKSKMFVLLATDDLDESTWVPQEIALAQEFNRKIVPINIDGALDKLPVEDARWLALKDRSRVEESLQALGKGIPSQHVSEKVDQAYTFTRRRVTAIRVLFLAGLIFFGLSIVAIGSSVYAVQVRQKAEESTNRLNQRAEQLQAEIAQAVGAKKTAEAEALAAQSEKLTAERARAQALGEKTKAQGEAAQAKAAKARAESDAQTAKTEKTVAEGDRDKARADAAEQQQIAKALGLANRAESVRDEVNGKLPTSLMLAAESMRRASTLEADQALRRGLALIPRIICKTARQDEVRHSHSNPRNTFSPDGKYLVTMGSTFVAVWKAAGMSDQPVARLKHDDRVYDFTFSPDGRYIVTTGEDRTVRVWADWQTGNPVAVATLQQSCAVNQVAISPKGKYLAVHDDLGDVYFWVDWNSPRAEQIAYTLRRYGTPDLSYGAQAFSGDETRFIMEINTNEIQAINPANGQKLGDPTAGVITDDRKFLISVAGENELKLSALDDLREIARVKVADAKKFIKYVDGVDYNIARRYLAMKNNGAVSVINTDDGTLVTKIPLGTIRMGRISFSPDGKLLAILEHYSEIVHIWRVAEDVRDEVMRLVAKERISLAVFSPDGKGIATLGSHSMRVWATTSYGKEQDFGIERDITSLAVSPDGAYIAAVSQGRLHILSAATNQEVAPPVNIKDQNAYSKCGVSFSRDGKFLAAACHLKTYIYRDWQTSAWLAGDVDSMYSNATAVFSPDNEYLAVPLGNAVGLWSKKEWGYPLAKPIRLPHGDYSPDMAFSPDGRFLVTSCVDGFIRVWVDWQSPQPRMVSSFMPEPNGGYFKGIIGLAISPDGKRLAATTMSEHLFVWEGWQDDATRRRVSRMNGISLRKIVFSPDGRHIAGTNYRSGSVWDATSGLEVARVTTDSIVSGIAFSHDGRYLITGGEGKASGFWLWRQPDMIEKACEYITEMDIRLSDEDWRQYLNGELPPQTCSSASTGRP